MTKFLDLAGLVALWAKIKSYVGSYVGNYVGDGKLFLQTTDSDDGDAVLIFSANEGNPKHFAIKAGTNISTGISTSSYGNVTLPVLTVSHSNPGSGSALTTNTTSTSNYAVDTEYSLVSDVTVNADTKGHITGVSVTKQKIKDTNTWRPVKVNGTSKISDTTTNLDFVNGTGINVEYTSNAVKHNLLTASSSTLGGVKIGYTVDTTNKKYPVELDTNNKAYVQVPWTDSLNVNDADLIFEGDSGSATVFNADEGDDHTVTFLGGNKITTQVIPALAIDGTSNTVEINHDAITTTTSDNGLNGDYPLSSGAVNVVTGVTLTTDGYGHVTNVHTSKNTIPLASQSTNGLMSFSDKLALDNINFTIATALTSAITPSGTKTASEFVTLVTLSLTILSSTGLGNLYTLSTPLVIGAAESGDTTLGDNGYTYFVEGTSLTASGSRRYELPAGTNLLIVNTGTSQSPVYKIDIMGTYDNTYWAKNELKPIPVDTSDPDYISGDLTIDSICV